MEPKDAANGGGPTKGTHLSFLRRMAGSQSARRIACAGAVLGGAGLQIAYIHSRHPSLLLRGWAAIYAALGVVGIAVFAVYAWRETRARFGKHRDLD
jgi:hypothetical protein